MQLYNQDVCIILETHLSGESLVHAKRWFSSSWGFYSIEFQDMAGDIIIVWKSDIAKFDIFHICTQQVCIVISKINSNPWLLSRIYASIGYR